MLRRLFKKNKLKNANSFVEPDEIFLDSKNLENFDSQQFEGRIEKQISKRTIIFLGVFLVIFILAFASRLGFLQIRKGETYLKISQNNTLSKDIIFAERGIIYDRNKVELAWNKKEGLALDPDLTTVPVPTKETTLGYSTRAYKTPGFSHVLGYVAYPAKDKSGNFWQTEFIGKDGLEKQYSDRLRGTNGSKIVETDVNKKVYSENVVNAPVRGADLLTTLDSRLQSELYALIQNLSEGRAFTGGAAVIMDVKNGEILAATSYPEYNSEILSLGENKTVVQNYLKDKRKVFLDRTISGLYTPGSIVKPYFAIGALNEGVIDPYKKILSTGSISIPNPYFPDQKTVFKDWRVNGWVDMRQAIAVSCDIYFYEIGGGYQDQRGLGILNLGKYARMFGIGQKTGVDLPDELGGTIPSPEWKAKNFKGDPWRIGDTYHTAIGQYGFQATPMEMTRAVASIANKGILISPHYLLDDTAKETQTLSINIPAKYFNIVQEGMRQGVTYGTAAGLNVPYVDVAAKTGTAQLGVSKNKVNSWVMGFFPYENPRYAFTVMMEAGPSTNSIGATSVMRGLLDWMSVNTPEYFK